ncbi:type III secretion system inner membrane ring lipoprotein SctJ [Rhizobium oryzicola]|uniref:Lipoprotein n=1 Tax=Rhizobium oryzicola TaxID=1232668 RepID=A0ABT8SXW1_9HYPH|nr:type III secretion inner membrane ring lipoprotein SctJ [Rhizobium oryzicola]MDO1583181.1 type III secretion inner membrane ring lipoprotein SctJ [Rhizobium oryzicola]
MTPRKAFQHFRLAFMIASLLALTACKADLYTNLTEYEANQMVAVLLAENIDASKTGVGEAFTVQVEQENLGRAIDLLNEKGFPRRTRESMGRVFQKSGIISSPFEERVRYIYALGEEVAQTISQIDGVVTARVHIVLPEEPQLGQPVKPSSAAVFIKHEPNVDLEFLVPQIRRLVSSSIQGLDYAAVTVVLTEAAARKAQQRAGNVDLVDVFPGLAVPAPSAPQVRIVIYSVAAALLILAAGSIFGVVQFVLSRRRRGSRTTTSDATTALMEPS